MRIVSTILFTIGLLAGLTGVLGLMNGRPQAAISLGICVVLLLFGAVIRPKSRQE